MLTAIRRLAAILTVSRKSPRLIEILMETEKIFRQGLLYQIFTLLFCRGQLRNIQSFKMHVLILLCPLDLLFCLILVAVGVVVCLRSLAC